MISPAAMLRLCIDIGNSRVKLALLEAHVAQREWVCALESLPGELQTLLGEGAFRPSACAVSCVSGVQCSPLLRPLRAQGIPYHLAGVGSVLPFRNGYARAEQLGSDRLCALVGAYALFPDSPLVVVDAGTALTLDSIDAAGVYRGGFITPGLRMRLRALHDYTKGLPLVDPGMVAVPPPAGRDGEAVFPLGRDTQHAIAEGVLQGMLAEIEHFARGCLGVGGEARGRVVLTGGDARILHNRANFPNFAVASLVLLGLDRLLDYNPS